MVGVLLKQLTESQLEFLNGELFFHCFSPIVIYAFAMSLNWYTLKEKEEEFLRGSNISQTTNIIMFT